MKLPLNRILCGLGCRRLLSCVCTSLWLRILQLIADNLDVCSKAHHGVKSSVSSVFMMSTTSSSVIKYNLVSLRSLVDVQRFLGRPFTLLRLRGGRNASVPCACLPELDASKNDVSSNEELASDWWEAAKLKIEGVVVDGFENDELMIGEIFGSRCPQSDSCDKAKSVAMQKLRHF